MPLPIQVGSVTQALQRAFGFKGRYTPLLDEVIVPVYVISDPAPASVTRLCAGNAQISTKLNFQAFVTLFNPVGSGIIIYVSSVVALASIKFTLRLAFFDDETSTSFDGTRAFRDRRNRGLPSGVIGRNNDVAGDAGERVALIQVDGALTQTASWETQTADPRQPLAVLGEGNGLIVQDNDPNTPADEEIFANFRWLEIPITEQRPAGGLP